MKRTAFRLALLAAAVVAPLALAPEAGAQQMNVKRSQVAPASASARPAVMERAIEDTRRLFQAQREFHAAHGRFAASLGELPEVALTTSFLHFSGGRDFYVVLAGSLDGGIVHEVVSIEPAAAHAQGTPGAPGAEG